MRFPPSLISGLFCLLIVMVFLPTAQSGRVVGQVAVTNPFQHTVWHEILQEHVRPDGGVHYDRLRAYPKRLNQYLEQLAQVSPESHPAYFPDRDAQLAYWINAHNAIALRLILDRYPIRSLAEIPDFTSNPRYLLGGKPYTLSEIAAHIQQQFPAVPNARLVLTHLTVSSPPLRQEAYQGSQLKAQLAEQARHFLQSTTRITTEGLAQCPQIQVSPTLETLSRQMPSQDELIHWLRPALSPEQQGVLARTCTPQILYSSEDLQLRK